MRFPRLGCLALLSLSMNAHALIELPIYIGTNTKKTDSKGIMVGSLELDSGKLGPVRLLAEIGNPNFLALTPDAKFLYASIESNGEGAVAAYKLEKDGTATLLNQQPSGGRGACHVWVGGGHLFVSNYSSGNLAAFPIKSDGSLDASTETINFTGTGPNAKRQQAPHAHGAYTDADARHLYVCDLGTDSVWSFALDQEKGKLTPLDPPAAKTPPGSGPRHLAISADGKFVFVNNELDMTVTAFERNSETGVLTAKQTLSTLPPGTSLEGVSTSEIALHPSGQWLYVSNRRHDSITVFAVSPEGQLTFVENVPSIAKIPRGFGIDPTGKWLVVAGQDDNRLVVQRIDLLTGKLTPTENEIAVSAPVSVHFP